MLLRGKIPTELDVLEKLIEAFKKKFDEDTDKVLARTSREDTNNTTVIRGGYPWATCFREACYLAKYIYRYKGKEKQDQDNNNQETEELNPNYFTEHLEEMAKVEQRWELWDDLVNKDSGLVAGLYKQKDYDPQSETALCPPTLVFRGTDFEDMRGVALLAKIGFIATLPGVPIPVPFWIRFSLSPEVKIAQAEQQAAAEKGETVSAATEELANSEGWGIGWKRDREDFIKDGYEEFEIYNRFGLFFAKIGEFLLLPFYASMDFKLSLYLYAKSDGDWANNIKQGLGKESAQYTEAIILGQKIVEDKIVTAKDKRLTITGHSLGGGLAAATCCVLAAENPTLLIQSIIFNAAGVHKNTITRELKSKDFALTAMANNPCIDICVRDEVLTTLGVHYKKLPLLGGVFNLVKRDIGQYGFPDPSDIAKVTDIKAISPGTSVESATNGTVATEFPPRGAALPILFPLDDQNAELPPEKGFPLIKAIDGIFNSSPAIDILATRLFGFLNDRYGKEARRKSSNPKETYQEMLAQFKNEIEPEIKVIGPILSLFLAYHGMDVVIASYENMLTERDLTENQKQQRGQEQQQQLEKWQEPQWNKEKQERRMKQAQQEYEDWAKHQNYNLSPGEWQNFLNMRF